MTYALRTDGDPFRYISAVRQIVHQADPRVPVTNVVTQAAAFPRAPMHGQRLLARAGHRCGAAGTRVAR